MRIGIFGGSFDPVHKEHVALCQAAMKGLSLDKIIVMPAGVPPHKQNKKLASGEDRLTMCRLAFAEMENVEISDYEIKKEGASFTYLTCRYLKELYSSATLFWLVGTDMFWNFFHWKNPEDILQNVTLAVCRRNEEEENIPAQQEAFFHRFQTKFAVIPYNGQAVSSTLIRARSALNLEIANLTPSAVAEYIQKNAVYDDERITAGLALEKPSRAEHSKRVCLLAMQTAEKYKEKYHFEMEKVLLASALHDVAKNLPKEDFRLQGFIPPEENIPEPVLHQYTGAYVLERTFSIKDNDLLNAVRYHTSGRENMSPLEELIFVCDMLEEGRTFPKVDELRRELDKGLSYCTYRCLAHQVQYLQKSGGDIYPLTLKAYDHYLKKEGEKKK